ncbi:MAG: hypothetical protein WC227_04690 [Patescibacteria group bacterium]|jgi:hypothetical protein
MSKEFIDHNSIGEAILPEGEEAKVLGNPQPEEAPEPVIKKQDLPNITADKLERNWHMILEIIHREASNNSNVRHILIEYADKPLSQDLPRELLGKLVIESQRTARITDRYNENKKFIDLPSVPEHRIGDQFYGSGTDDLMETISQEETTSPEEEENRINNVRHKIKHGFYHDKITGPEATSAISHYKFARDLKLLALEAELLENKDKIPEGDDEFILPSGIKILANTADGGRVPSELFDPRVWEKRTPTSYRNRTFLLEAGGKKYILKEKRTGRHDLKASAGAMSAEQEYEISKDLVSACSKTHHDHLGLRWERPICSVSFPDGFQFVVYEHAGDLLDGETAKFILQQQIITNKEQFGPEFEKIRAEAKDTLTDPAVNEMVAFSAPEETFGAKLKRWFGKKKEKELTFEQYSLIKSSLLENFASKYLKRVVSSQGYLAADGLQHAFQVENTDQLRLVAIGFDTEHFKHEAQDNDDMSKYSDELERQLCFIPGEKTPLMIAATHLMLTPVFNGLKSSLKSHEEVEDKKYQTK